MMTSLTHLLTYLLTQVDNALAAFMNERTRAVNSQADAMRMYDAEMLQIMKEVEDEEMRAKCVIVPRLLANKTLNYP